jgi:hypothetical protein
MRKLIGLCFLTATLLASSANAQSIFVEKGDPSTMSFTLGGAYGGLYGGSFDLSYSYRGVLDIGVDASGAHFSSGDNKNLTAANFMPFVNIFAYRPDEFPLSLSFLFGFSKVLYTGNDMRGGGGSYAAPNGWGLVLGPTVSYRIDLGTSMMLIPEVIVAYDFMFTRYYTNAQDQSAPSVGDSQQINGYRETKKHSARGLVRANLAFKSGDHLLTVTPYGGYQGTWGGVVGLLVGFVL